MVIIEDDVELLWKNKEKDNTFTSSGRNQSPDFMYCYICFFMVQILMFNFMVFRSGDLCLIFKVLVGIHNESYNMSLLNQFDAFLVCKINMLQQLPISSHVFMSMMFYFL